MNPRGRPIWGGLFFVFHLQPELIFIPAKSDIIAVH